MKNESSVKERYAAARQREASLCCPVDYLEAIPPEVIERDYGCGDPSRYLRPGETVLDLGAGTGKICFIAAQVVGAEGRVIGVDMTDDMLDIARRHAPAVAERIGYANVEFRKGRIQDLGLDLEVLDAELKKRPITDAGFHGIELLKFETEPWQTVEGIQFRSVTVQAWKGKQGPCYEHNQAVVYTGPFREVRDDDGHRYPRGERVAVCDKTFRLLKTAPYTNFFAFL